MLSLGELLKYTLLHSKQQMSKPLTDVSQNLLKSVATPAGDSGGKIHAMIVPSTSSVAHFQAVF